MSRREVGFFDLRASLSKARPRLDEAWGKVLGHGLFVGGPEVDEFEANFADFCGAAECVGVANGTDALELALRALGIGPGDEVIVPTNTFIATAEAVSNVGATPRFADVDPATLLLDVDNVKNVVTSSTAAVIAVHLYGQPCNMEGLAGLANDLGLALIEDAAQAHGALDRGSPPGTHSAAATFSFYPGKNLGALGDGGAVVTNDSDLAARVRSIGAHGRSESDRYLHTVVGRNSRLDTLQAAMLSVRLEHLPEENAHRERVHRLYAEGLPGSVQLVEIAPDRVSSHHLIVAQVDDRERFRADLADRGVATGLHYPVPCHLQEAYDSSDREVSLPVAEEAAGRIVSLPVWGQMPESDVEYVCEQIRAVRP